MDQVVHNIFPTAVMEFKLPFDTATIKTQLETYNSQLKPHAVFDGNATTTTDEEFHLLADPQFDGLRIAVSPIVNNYAIRGPLAKIMSELGVVPSCTEIAKYYKDICDIFVIDSSDSLNRRGIENLGMDVFVTDIIMNNDESKKILAEKLMNYLK